LAERWGHYAAYPSLRTAAFLGRETVRSGLRVLVAGPAGRGDPGRAPLPEMVRWAGGLSGGFGWRFGAVAPRPRPACPPRHAAPAASAADCQRDLAPEAPPA